MHQDPLNCQIQNRESEERTSSLDILDLALKLIRQQIKLEWTDSGDQCTQLFFAKMKQCKHANYISAINNIQGIRKTEFEAVAKIITGFYQELIEEQKEERTPIIQSIVNKGPVLNTEWKL